ncbi:hypothetical protein BDZ89DRAFT_1150018 [Hymenopellis radicata]|nr:hypothetical protein BDZ89DRAFT_1150018 [Hymenopellis radicata]
MSPDPLDGFQRTQTPSSSCHSSLEELVNDFSAGKITSLHTFLAAARATGASPHEIKNYVDQVIALREYYEPDRSKSPSQERVQSLNEQEACLRTALNETAWAQLEAKIRDVEPPCPVGNAQDHGVSLLECLLRSDPSASISTSTGLSPAILAAAPHLAHLSSPSSLDQHVQQTIELCRTLAVEKDVDFLVELLQAYQIKDFFAQSFWHLIIQDRYVDFEKLFASLSGTVNHHDDSQTFAGSYLLVKKDTNSVLCFQITQS